MVARLATASALHYATVAMSCMQQCWHFRQQSAFGATQPDEAWKEYFPVTDSDVARTPPGALISRGKKAKPVFFTARFFLEMTQKLYECFNSREARRHLAAIYSSNALSASLRMERSGDAPYSFAWRVPWKPAPTQ